MLKFSFFVQLVLLDVLVFGTTLVNGPAASVGKDLITVQDAYIFRSIQRYKAREYPAVKNETGEALKRTVQKAAFEHMVFLELKSMQFEEGDATSTDKEVQEIKRKGKSQEWDSIVKKFQVTEKTATERLHRTVQVEHFMQKKVDTLTPIITEQETERFFKENPGKFKGSSFQQMKANIQAMLRKQQIQKGLEEWIQFLKEKYGFAILLEG